MLPNMINTIKLNSLVTNGDYILIALSGGCDSSALLHSLYDLRDSLAIRIAAMHINHCLRGQSSANDEFFCKSLCISLGVPFFSETHNVSFYANKNGITIEEAGRKIRYNALTSKLNELGATKIATGHNKNDNAETIILNITRGTGISGLCGIPVKRGNIIRPLIQVSRNEIEVYCLKNNVKYITDETNNDLIYTRNKIRHLILPQLKNINTNVVNTLSDTSQIFSVEEDYLQSQAKEAYKNCVTIKTNEILININKLDEMHTSIKMRIFRLAILYFSKNLQNLSIKHINSLLNLLNKPTGTQISLPFSLTAKISYGFLILRYNDKKLLSSKNFSYLIKLGSFLYIKELGFYISSSYGEIFKEKFINTCTKSFNCDRIDDTLTLRTRQPGDLLYINGVGTQTLKKFFINKKIPKEERNIPILAQGNNILCVFGKYTSSLYSSNNINNTDTIYVQIWQKM